MDEICTDIVAGSENSEKGRTRRRRKRMICVVSRPGATSAPGKKL
jgi:hypothetical protein